MAKKRRSSQFKDSSQVIDIEEARRKRQEKRRRQNKKRSGEGMPEDRPVRVSIKQYKRRRALIYTAIIAVIIAVVGVSVYNIASLKKEQKEKKTQQQQLKEEKANLEKQLEKLDDSEYIKDQARAQLRLVMPGEKIYVFPSLENSENNSKKGDSQKDED